MLTFPTQAEQALAEFKAATKTISLSTIAKRRGAVRDDDFPYRVFVFDDDTCVKAIGRGKAFIAWTELP